MKKIEAFVKEHRLDPVVRALRRLEGLTGMTATSARGFGRGRGGNEIHPTSAMIHDFEGIVRIDAFCEDTLVDEVVDTIEQAGHTGLRGDGKIYVLSVEQAVRISTGERGDSAI